MSQPETGQDKAPYYIYIGGVCPILVLIDYSKKFIRTKTNETMSDLFPNLPSKKGSPIPKRIFRIPLNEACSAALDETGLPAFGIIGCERIAGHPRRWLIYVCEPRHPAALLAAVEIMKTAANNQTPEP
jgi:hypothetical protein